MARLQRFAETMAPEHGADGGVPRMRGAGGVVTRTPGTDGVVTGTPAVDGAATRAPVVDGAVPQTPGIDSVITRAPGANGVATQAPRIDGAVTRTPGVDSVVARMRVVGGGGSARDGVGVFNRVYLTVTEEVGRHIGLGAFPDTRAAATLGVRFAERYLAAVDAAADGRRPPACWRPLFQYRRHPGVRPLQFALAGINAHIGHDLALAVVDACHALGCEPADLEDEFDRVGDILVALEERIREELMPGPDLLQIGDPLTHLAGSWSLERARDGAWAAARTLWALRELPGVAEEFAERLDGAVGLVGRILLTPLPD